MSTTSGPSPTSTDRTGAAQSSENQTIKTFAASLSTAAVIFGAQITLFLIFSGNWKIRRSKHAGEKPTERQSLFHKI
jgi:hypothetical protein